MSYNNDCYPGHIWLQDYSNLNHYQPMFTTVVLVTLPIMFLALIFIYITFTDFRRYQHDSSSSLSRTFVVVKVSADGAVIVTFLILTLLVLYFIHKTKNFVMSIECVDDAIYDQIKSYMDRVVMIVTLSELPLRLALWISFSIGLVTQLEKYIYIKYPLHYSRVKTPRVKKICLTLCLGISTALIAIDVLMLLFLEEHQTLVITVCYLVYDSIIILVCVPLNTILWRHIILTYSDSITYKSETKIFFFIFGWMITNLTLLIMIDLATLIVELNPGIANLSNALLLGQIVLLLLYPVLSMISLLIVYPAYGKICRKYFRSTTDNRSANMNDNGQHTPASVTRTTRWVVGGNDEVFL